MPKKEEKSYGIVVLKRVKRHWEVLLVKHGKGHWAFPKGHAEMHETPIGAAARELKEETGLSIKKLLPFPSLEEHYFFRAGKDLIDKTVTYFLAETQGEVDVQKEEILDFCWVDIKEAANVATFPATKNVCKQVYELLKNYS